MEDGMQIRLIIGDREWSGSLWVLLLQGLGIWMLVTYGEAALDGFIAGLTGQPPR
jgi:hypothetical protein